MRNLLIVFLCVMLTGCAVGMPFQIVDETAPKSSSTPYVVAVTEATLLADRAARAKFWSGVWNIERALPQQPGLVGYALRREILGDKVWTMTVWKNDDDLETFIKSDLHRRNAREGYSALASMRTARFTRKVTDGIPDWSDAEAQLARKAEP